MVVLVTATVLSLPLTGFVPPQAPPEAAQLVAFVDDQVRVVNPPLATLVGLAERVTVGAGTTVTVAVAGFVVPPMPVQISV